jgi:acetyl esterase/lipase
VTCPSAPIPVCADLFFPNVRCTTPALIFFHAGGGDKRQVRPAEFEAALARGYVVVSANFREPPYYPLPSP